ncbi:transient receptor potential cation channel subfamily M member 2-like [Biomphalaria glabrata]|uniref:Transient receptor potential cation channel subfamily M member 2-like n=1 Tax=Biomphalaria glabrata TaxID=6526 RepID=A0A9W3A4R3_BIOGL|nr:transient receptor potential cation channel subfamily M member 2-like [Biomphalaria glabrata]XP_055882158.1 transient receptor potential cation channel subfamily M member 2-like [Biomphalaria glabrata]
MNELEDLSGNTSDNIDGNKYSKSSSVDSSPEIVFINEKPVSFEDLGLGTSGRKYTLFVRLKLLPKDLNNKIVIKFIYSLINAIAYKECLLIELDAERASLIGTQVHLTEAKVKGIMTRAEYEKVEKVKQKLKSTFEKLFIHDDNYNLKINVEQVTEVCICEIKVETEANESKRKDETTHSEGDSGGDDQEEDDWDYDGDYDNEFYNFSDDDDDYEYYDDEEYDDVRNSSRTPSRDNNSVDSNAQLIIKHTDGDKPDHDDGRHSTPKEGTDNDKRTYLTLKEACKVDILKRHIYETTMQQCKIKRTEVNVNAFYLSLALDHVDKKLTSKVNAEFEWELKDLDNVLVVIVTDFKTNFLEQLLELHNFRPEVIERLKVIIASRDGPRHAPTYTIFRQYLYSAGLELDDDKNGCFLQLFMDAIEHNQFDASLYYWTKLKHLTWSALLARLVLKKKKESASFKYEKVYYDKYLRIYEDIAINVLDACYSKDNRITWILLTKSVEILNESCIALALKTRNKLFLQQEACVAVNHASWHFYIGNDLDFSKLKHGIKESLFSPRGRCRMDMISYLLFLTAYSVLLVSTLNKTTFHWLEAVVMGYLVTFLIRELDQCCKSLKQCKAYIYDPFNILDQLSIAMAFIAWSLRWAAYVIPEEERLMIAARYLLCLNFMLYMFRFLEFFYQNKLLGPMLVVIRNMVETYINFLLILMIFWVAYSVVSESILFPEKEIKKDILYYVFRRGFWAMMGEYFLDEVEHFSDNACISPNSANSSTKSCATADGRYTIPILLAAYVLFVQILMFNLLVALFNNAISDNEAKRDMIWRYQTFLLTMQYAKSKILLPPFLPFIFLLNGKSGNPFKLKDGKNNIVPEHFERNAAQKIINHIIKGRYDKIVSDDDMKEKINRIENKVNKLSKLYTADKAKKADTKLPSNQSSNLKKDGSLEASSTQTIVPLLSKPVNAMKKEMQVSRKERQHPEDDQANGQEINATETLKEIVTRCLSERQL